MKATDLLKTQHKEVKSLFERIEKSKKDSEKRELFEDLAAKLVSHDGIEREIFYPACKEAMGMTPLLGEAVVEHGVIEFSLYLADRAQGKEDFGDKVTVLSEMVLHHVKEEEDELFPQVEKAMAAGKLDELGAKMKARFEAAKKEDFRAPLHENLRLVLGRTGEISATKNPKSPPAKQGPAGAGAAKNGGSKKSAGHGRVQT
jgi:hemerythrin superfamily protein